MILLRKSVLTRCKYGIVCLLILTALFVACSPGKGHPITGKWSLSAKMMGGIPSSFWFKGNGTVIAPWEDQKYALRSSGTYELLNGKRIKISMKEGYYKDKVYFFDIVKIDAKEMVLRSNYEDIRLKRVE